MAAKLSRIEKISIEVCRSINERSGLKTLQRLYLKNICSPVVTSFTSNLRSVYGLDKLHALAPDQGVILCANHRSLFDLYVVAAVMYEAKLPWNHRHYYPVRSNYFYETLSGLTLNLLIGGGSMYPPIFRDTDKSDLTKHSIGRVIQLLQQPGAVVSLHPEGTRNQNKDPFDTLPAQPGIGQIAHQSQALVIPIWIRGLCNDLGQQVRGNYQTGAKRGPPVVVAFGEPVDLDAYRQKKGRLAIYKRMSDKIMSDIDKLCEEDRLRSGI